MNADELKAMIEEQARLSGMTPEELTQKTAELIGLMGKVDISSLFKLQRDEFALASKEIARRSKALRERMKNGTRRTSGTIRLPV